MSKSLNQIWGDIFFKLYFTYVLGQGGQGKFPLHLASKMYLFGTRFFKLILVEAIPDIVSLSNRFGVFLRLTQIHTPFFFKWYAKWDVKKLLKSI